MRYLHVASALPLTAAKEVSDILARFNLNGPADAYHQLKVALLASAAPLERTRIQQLLSEEVGGSRPSELLRRLTQRLGTRTHTVEPTLMNMFQKTTLGDEQVTAGLQANLNDPALEELTM